MPDAERALDSATYIAAPRDPRVKALYNYWAELRRDRAIPSRADFDPSAIPALLPFIVLYGVGEDGGYTVRLVGEEIIQFAGRNAAGGPAGHTMPPRAQETLLEILQTVTRERTPRFRAGKAHWHPDKGHRDFEACFLPLTADGGRISAVLTGIAFPRAAS